MAVNNLTRLGISAGQQPNHTPAITYDLVGRRGRSIRLCLFSGVEAVAQDPCSLQANTAQPVGKGNSPFPAFHIFC